MKTIAILGSGESLAYFREQIIENYTRPIAINHAILLGGLKDINPYYVYMDDEGKGRGDGIAKESSTYNLGTMKGLKEYSFDGQFFYTIEAAIAMAEALGATHIHFYGVDLKGELDITGKTGGNRNDRRWAKEARRLLQQVCHSNDARGTHFRYFQP